MKKLSFLLAVLLVIMCIPMTAMTTVSAADITFTPTAADEAAIAESKFFKVGSTYYQYYNEAFNAAKAAGGENTIDIISDVTISAGNASERATAGFPSEDIVINGNGFTLTDNYGNSAYGWKIDNNQTYTVYVKNITVKTKGFFQLKGNVVLEDVSVTTTAVPIEPATSYTYGAVLLQPNTYVVITGDSYVASNPARESVNSNSDNPVFKLNDASNIRVDIAGNTEVVSYNSVFMGFSNKSTIHNNVTFNIYDNAHIRTTNSNRIAFNCEWRNIGINMYGGTINANNGDGAAANVGGGNPENCVGSYLNLYGGEIKGNVMYDETVCDMGIYGGKFTANGVTYDTNGFTQTKGASIRHTTGSSGIRFQSVIPASVYNSLKDLETAGTITDLKIGTIIVPYDYLNFAYNGQITKDCLDGITYLDIPATNALGALDGYDWETTGIAIRGAIIGIQEKNLDRDFVATGYIEWTDKEGEVFTVYSNPLPTEDNARNVSEIAWEALSQVSSDVTEGYNYSTTTYVADGQLVKNGVATKYSKYDQEAMDNMAALVKQ